MVVLGAGLFLMSEVPLCIPPQRYYAVKRELFVDSQLVLLLLLHPR